MFYSPPPTCPHPDLFVPSQHKTRSTAADRGHDVVYADWCGPCKAIAPLFQKLSETAAGVPSVRFAKVDTEAKRDVAAAYDVTALPTFIVFKDGQVLERIQGADPRKLQQAVTRLAGHLLSGGGSSSSNNGGGAASASGSSSGNGNSGGANGSWRGASLPRGYTDITDQIEPKGCELLNADDNSGSVKVLFDGSKPSALGEKKSDEGKNKDWVESGEDDQLLLFMPFQSMLKLHTLQVFSLCTLCFRHFLFVSCRISTLSLG